MDIKLSGLPYKLRRRAPAGARRQDRSGPVSRLLGRRWRRRPRRYAGWCRACALGEVVDDGGLDRRRQRRRSPRWSSISDADRIAAVGSAFCWPAMSGAEPCTGSNMEGVVRSGLTLPRRGQADAAGDRGGEVGDDVAEEVVGDDHVEAGRVGGHEDHRRVDVQVVDGDVGELRGRPRSTSRHQTAPAWTSTLVLWTRVSFLRGTALGAGERVADHPLDAERGVDADLGGDLGRRADAQRAAVAGVGTLGALADHHEVDVAGVRPAATSRPGRSATDAG